jgi:hypothetical protein
VSKKKKSQCLLGKIAIFYINNAALADPFSQFFSSPPNLYIAEICACYKIYTDNGCQEN